MFKSKDRHVEEIMTIKPQVVTIWGAGGNNTAYLSYELAKQAARHTTVLLAELPCLGIPRLAVVADLKERNKNIDQSLLEYERKGVISLESVHRISGNLGILAASPCAAPDHTATDRVEKTQSLVEFPANLINQARLNGYSTIIFEAQGQLTTPLTFFALKLADKIIIPVDTPTDIAWTLVNIKKLREDYNKENDFPAAKFVITARDDLVEVTGKTMGLETMGHDELLFALGENANKSKPPGKKIFGFFGFIIKKGSAQKHENI